MRPRIIPPGAGIARAPKRHISYAGAHTGPARWRFRSNRRARPDRDRPKMKKPPATLVAAAFIERARRVYRGAMTIMI